MNTTSERDWIPGRQRVCLALHSLSVLFFALWFGAGVVVLVFVLMVILTGQMQWAVGVPERVLVTALVVLAIVGFGACAIAMGRAGVLPASRGRARLGPLTKRSTRPGMAVRKYREINVPRRHSRRVILVVMGTRAPLAASVLTLDVTK